MDQTLLYLGWCSDAAANCLLGSVGWVSSPHLSIERVKPLWWLPRSDLNAVTFEEVDKVFY